MPVRARMTWTLTIAAGFGLGIAGEASAQTTAKKAATPAQAPPKAGTPAPVDAAATKAQAIAPSVDPAALDTLLANWEAQSRKVLSLYVEFDRFDESAKSAMLAFRGKALLKSPDLACYEHTKCKVDDKGKAMARKDPATNKVIMDLEKDPEQRIVCTGTEVLEFAWDIKVVHVYPLNKDIRQKALQEGPLPFLFNMKAAEVRRRYKMTLMKATEDFHVIQIEPLEEIDKSSFEKAYLWLGKTDFLPHQLKLAKVAKEISTYNFTKIIPNLDLEDKFFHPDRNLLGWQVKVNPDGDQPPRQAAVPGPYRPGAAPKRATTPPQQGMNPAAGRPR